MNGFEILAPGEEVLDRLPFRSYSRQCELWLTDRRLVVQGHTGVLPVQLMLPRGPVAAAIPLTRLDGFIIGRGRRSSLLFLALAFAIAGIVMVLAPWAESIYLGLVAFSVAAVVTLAWTAWPVTFFSIFSEAFRISGNTRLTEALVFLERVELSSECCRRGLSPEEVRDRVKLSGNLAVLSGNTDESKKTQAQG